MKSRSRAVARICSVPSRVSKASTSPRKTIVNPEIAFPGFINHLAATHHAPLSQRLEQRKLVIVQFRKRDAFRVAIKLFILLLVSHFT